MMSLIHTGRMLLLLPLLPRPRTGANSCFMICRSSSTGSANSSSSSPGTLPYLLLRCTFKKGETGASATCTSSNSVACFMLKPPDRHCSRQFAQSMANCLQTAQSKGPMSIPVDKASRSKTESFTMAGLRGPQRQSSIALPLNHAIIPLPDDHQTDTAVRRDYFCGDLIGTMVGDALGMQIGLAEVIIDTAGSAPHQGSFSAGFDSASRDPSRFL